MLIHARPSSHPVSMHAKWHFQKLKETKDANHINPHSCKQEMSHLLAMKTPTPRYPNEMYCQTNACMHSIVRLLSLPETAPSDVMLAQVLQFCSLDKQLVYLQNICQLLVRFEVVTSKLLLDSVQDLHCALVLGLLDIDTVHTNGALRCRICTCARSRGRWTTGSGGRILSHQC